ncbi:hypothetical protein DRN52_07150 [Thermococci archaeon]|nr:MAG: hypothetical protein DRN52_07150 [Thermococci archaeon]
MRHKGQLIWPGRENGLVLWIPFYEGSGTTTHDLSGYDNHGTINGATWTNGYRGYGLYFDGVEDYAEVHGSASLDITDEITIVVWAKPNGANEMGYFVAKGNPADYQRYNLYWDGANDQLVFWESGTDRRSDKVCIDDNVWVQAVVVVDGTTLKFYRNGVPAGTKTLSNPLESNNDALRIGHRVGTPSDARCFKGIIDEVRIYNRVLSEEEIKKHYLAGLARLRHRGLL